MMLKKIVDKKPMLRDIFRSGSVHRIPCAYDGISAKIAEKSGFKAVAFSGNAVSASVLGMPDLGVLGMSENISHAARISQNLDIPLICDADTGYGGIMNVIRTVREFEMAGICGIHIEDQVTPKRCGLLPLGIPVVETSEQVIKIRSAVEASTSKDFLIIARTDAKSMHGLENAAQRARTYIESGADAALIMGANTPDELRYVASIVKAPLVCVIQESPPTTELTDALLNEVGCSLALHAGIARYAVVKSLMDAYKALMVHGSTQSVKDKMATFEEYNDALDLNNWLEIEKYFLSTSTK